MEERGEGRKTPENCKSPIEAEVSKVIKNVTEGEKSAKV